VTYVDGRPRPLTRVNGRWRASLADADVCSVNGPLHWLVQPTIAYIRRRVSEWVDTGQALQCWYHYDFDTSRYDEHSRPFCTHSLAHRWCNCRPPVPTQVPNALHDRSTAENVRQLGSQARCARRATSIRRRRRRCGMWAAHARDVCSCAISYDICPPRYRTLDESAIDIAISCNRYDH